MAGTSIRRRAGVSGLLKSSADLIKKKIAPRLKDLYTSANQFLASEYYAKLNAIKQNEANDFAMKVYVCLDLIKSEAEPPSENSIYEKFRILAEGPDDKTAKSLMTDILNLLNRVEAQIKALRTLNKEINAVRGPSIVNDYDTYLSNTAGHLAEIRENMEYALSIASKK